MFLQCTFKIFHYTKSNFYFRCVIICYCCVYDYYNYHSNPQEISSAGNQSINSFQPIRMQELKLTNQSLKAVHRNKDWYWGFTLFLYHNTAQIFCNVLPFFFFNPSFFIREKSERTVLFWTF